MSKFLDYKKAYHEALLFNLKQVRELIISNDKEMENKIINFSEKYDIPKALIRNKILQDNIFALQFAKDLSRQTFHQNLASNFIVSLDGIKNFKVLPAGGKNALYVIDGKLGNEKEAQKGTSKSIDFYWEYENFKCYGAHKYTELDGGSQDNQYTDLMNFLKNASKCQDDNILFFAIGNGAYYQRKHTKIKNEFNTKNAN